MDRIRTIVGTRNPAVGHTVPPQSLKIAICWWFSGIWCVHKLHKQCSTLYNSEMENNLTQVFRSKPGRPAYRGKRHIPPILAQGVELFV